MSIQGQKEACDVFQTNSCHVAAMIQTAKMEVTHISSEEVDDPIDNVTRRMGRRGLGSFRGSPHTVMAGALFPVEHCDKK